MGHVRLGDLPKSREWEQVVELLAKGSDVTELAAAVAIAAEDELISARGDPVLANTVWLLTQLPLAARTNRFAAELTALGFLPGSEQSLLNIVAGFSGAVDRQISGTVGRTDLGELARQAASESLASLVGAQMSGLFGANPADLRIELGKFATKDRFAILARDFFARLTLKTLDYYLSRILANHVGPDRALPSLEQQAQFRGALEHHCREASLIVEQFAGGWFSKANYQGRLTRGSAQSFSDYALKKIRDELRARRADNA
jgi:hypothetical protein